MYCALLDLHVGAQTSADASQGVIQKCCDLKG